jgi:hypothetical protein
MVAMSFLVTNGPPRVFFQSRAISDFRNRQIYTDNRIAFVTSKTNTKRRRMKIVGDCRREIGASIPQLRSIQDRFRGGATRAIIKAIFEIANSIKTTKMLTIACVGFRRNDEL